MVAKQQAGVREVDARTLKVWLDAGEALLVDVREPAEHAAERIPQAELRPSSTFDPAAIERDGRKLVVHCASGMRAAGVCDKLLGCGCDDVYLFRGGVAEWRAAGFPVEETAGRAHLSVLRQTQLTVGVMVFLGTVLGAAVSPWFLLLPGMMGCGLMFAGLSGRCPLADVIARLPYNRGVECETCASH